MQEATTNEPQGEDPVDDLKVLITAGEAYPELERAFLNAQKEITAGFHIFDLTTRLRSSAARETGETWFDLFLATVNRGVSIRVVVADFDPVCAPALHRTAWQAKRQIMAVREVAKARAGRLDCVVALHSAHTGSVPRVLCYPFVRYRLRKLARYWRKLDPAQRKGVMSEAPRLKPVCYEDEQGRLRLPPRLVDLYPATHHQKIAVFDRRKVYVGGLDLNERRFDTKRHRRPAEATWHDVQLMATGPVAQAAQHHLESFLDTVDGASPPAPARGFLRTISRRRKSAPVRMAPKPVVREIEDRHERAIGQARQLVYLETQFLRHVPLARTLARRARERPGLRLIVVLPAAPEQVAFATSRALDAQYGEYQQMRCLSVLKGAFGQDRMVVASPVQPRRRQSDGRAALKAAPIIYVHSKVSIFDGSGAIVSSANLNGRSLRWDTECGLYLNDRDHVEQLRERVMGHWLPEDAGEEYLDPARAFDAWRKLVENNTASPPHQRQGLLVRYNSDAAQDVAAAAPGVPEEMV